MNLNKSAESTGQAIRVVFWLAVGLASIPVFAVLMGFPALGSGIATGNQAFLVVAGLAGVCVIVLTVMFLAVRVMDVYYNTKIRQELQYARAYEEVRHQLEWQEQAYHRAARIHPTLPPTEIDPTIAETGIVPFKPMKRRVASRHDAAQ